MLIAAEESWAGPRASARTANDGSTQGKDGDFGSGLQADSADAAKAAVYVELLTFNLVQTRLETSASDLPPKLGAMGASSSVGVAAHHNMRPKLAQVLNAVGIMHQRDHHLVTGHVSEGFVRLKIAHPQIAQSDEPERVVVNG